ncbi:MAG: 50S ribosomal protein L15 [Candidatus Krumholzibacteria bacterium]|nr:50S ribosomal protein L15 [Candidatus Krumholzibacteria bacterium]
MKLSELKPARGATKKNKRVGCGPGSGHGRYSTRGCKGQKARSGGSIPAWFEGGQMPLQRRVPKRGFVNNFKTYYQVVNLDSLGAFAAGAKVNRGTLLEAGLVRKASGLVKILGRGELKVALDVEVDAVSRTAADAIRKAGGTIHLLSGKKAPGLENVEKR